MAISSSTRSGGVDESEIYGKYGLSALSSRSQCYEPMSRYITCYKDTPRLVGRQAACIRGIRERMASRILPRPKIHATSSAHRVSEHMGASPLEASQGTAAASEAKIEIGYTGRPSVSTSVRLPGYPSAMVRYRLCQRWPCTVP